MATNYLRLYSDYKEGGYFLLEINHSIDSIQGFEITYFTKRGPGVGVMGDDCGSIDIISKDLKSESSTLIDNYELTLYINKPCFRLRKF